MQRQEGRVAIVTGGVRDVGVAIARQLIAEGATAVVADLHDDDGAKLVAELGDRARYVHLDVASEEEWSTLPEAILSEFGRIDVLVNAADYNEFTPMIPLTKMDPKMVGDRPVGHHGVDGAISTDRGGQSDRRVPGYAGGSSSHGRGSARVGGERRLHRLGPWCARVRGLLCGRSRHGWADQGGCLGGRAIWRARQRSER